MQEILVALQLFQVLFIGLHDWVPLGSFNDVRAVRRANPGGKLLLSTVLSTAPFAALLIFSAMQVGQPYSSGLLTWLWIGYGLLFAGELRAWWVPYFFGTDAARVDRYKAMFGATHAFLPARNGIRINTLHAILHAVTLVTLVLLGLIPLRG